MNYMIHPSSDVQTVSIGDGSRIWQYCVILPKAAIGAECNICSHVFIENDVSIGDRVTIKCGVQIWDGITIEDDVFIGPNATFTNDLFPQIKKLHKELCRFQVESHAVIGANATILPGLVIGRGAMVAAGAVVTRDVLPHTLVVGNPARERYAICRCSRQLCFIEGRANCHCGCIYLKDNTGGIVETQIATTTNKGA